MQLVNVARWSMKQMTWLQVEHTIKLVNKTGEPIATEGIYTLNNAGKGMFEMKKRPMKFKKANQLL